MSSDYEQFEQRKQDHIDYALNQQTQTPHLSGLDAVQLPHEALPDLDFADIDISCMRFTQRVSSPFFISSMTAGHKGATNINKTLVAACAKSGWWMGVGSQRRELSDDTAKDEWQTLRSEFPDVKLMSNIGIAQAITHPLDDIKRLVDNLNACAVIIHLNPLQECIQPEGTPQFKGGLQAIEKIAKALAVPVIVKETGCGFSAMTLKRLKNTGIAAVDVSGLGGTHWGRIEGMRAKPQSLEQQAAITFRNWGVTSSQSVINASTIKPDYETWGSGGVRSGLDAAKLIYLGAKSIGVAKPMLEAALIGVDAVCQQMQSLEHELKIALFCSGHATCHALQQSRNNLCQ